MILGLAPGPSVADLDVRLRGGCVVLSSAGLDLKDGPKVVLKEDEAVSGVQVARVCRVLSRAPNDTVRAAFVERGVPDEAILRVSSATVLGTEVHTLTKIVHLVPGFPLEQIPWKVPLQEPGSCLEPHKVTVQGSHCIVCRALDHKKNGCAAFKQKLCGRCDFSFSELKSQGKNTAIHDCEGGPGGYGPEHMDLLGDKWHRIWSAWRDSAPPSEVIADPLAAARNASLQAAKAAAVKQQAKMAKKKAPRPARAENEDKDTSTPPAKRVQLGAAVPKVSLPAPEQK